ncbi:hypothetical protein V6N13_129808 [Hibiscus sabdariffa]
MVEGGNTREESERESVGTKGAGSVEWRAGGSDNKLWEDDGAVMALAGDGESGFVSMSEDHVGMVSREAEVERGMADGRVVVAVVDASDLAGRSNPVEEIEFDPNSTGGLVVA